MAVRRGFAGERLQPLGHLTTQRLFRVLRV